MCPVQRNRWGFLSRNTHKLVWINGGTLLPLVGGSCIMSCTGWAWVVPVRYQTGVMNLILILLWENVAPQLSCQMKAVITAKSSANLDNQDSQRITKKKSHVLVRKILGTFERSLLCGNFHHIALINSGYHLLRCPKVLPERKRKHVSYCQ